MSRRFKRSKPLGKGKRSTTSSDEESLKRLPAVPDSVDDEVYDFLYVDRVRVSALYAQLFPQGTLKSVKTTAQHGFSDDQNIGSDIKILKAEAKSTTAGSEGIEHVFDAAWAIPVEVLSALQKRSLVRYSFTNAQLGVIVLLNGYLRIIDYVTMKDLWVPAFTLMAGEQQPGLKGLLDLIRSIPHAMHAHFLTNQGFLWASLDSTNLHAPPADIVLKHGGYISSGLWRVLFMLDTFPDIDTVPAMQSWGAGQAADGVLTATQALRTQLGRPPNWAGITPLMIYRTIPPFTGQESLDLPPPAQL